MKKFWWIIKGGDRENEELRSGEQFFLSCFPLAHPADERLRLSAFEAGSYLWIALLDCTQQPSADNVNEPKTFTLNFFAHATLSV